MARRSSWLVQLETASRDARSNKWKIRIFGVSLQHWRMGWLRPITQRTDALFRRSNWMGRRATNVFRREPCLYTQSLGILSCFGTVGSICSRSIRAHCWCSTKLVPVGRWWKPRIYNSSVLAKSYNLWWIWHRYHSNKSFLLSLHLSSLFLSLTVRDCTCNGSILLSRSCSRKTTKAAHI